jgi:hypothetical protein
VIEEFMPFGKMFRAWREGDRPLQLGDMSDRLLRAWDEALSEHLDSHDPATCNCPCRLLREAVRWEQEHRRQTRGFGV